MKVKTEDLRSAFKVVDFVPVNTVLDSSQFVRLRQEGDKLSLALSGTLWAEASITGQAAGGKWTAYLERKLFKTFLATASKDEIEIYYKDKVTLVSGQRLELALHAVIKGYETWAPKVTLDLEDDQKTLLKTLVKYLPTQPGFENVDAVHFDKDLIMVTNTLAMMAVTGSVVKSHVLLPPDIARFLASTPMKLGTDKNGIGVALTNGFVYQPRSAQLDSYPLDACTKVIDSGYKADAVFTVAAEEFLDAVRSAVQFLPDKSDAVVIEAKAKSDKLSITVDTSTGKFQRTINISTVDAVVSAKLQAKLFIPWLEYASSSMKDCELEFVKPKQNFSGFRFTDKPRENLFMAADL